MADWNKKQKLHKMRDALAQDDLSVIAELMLDEGEIGKLANAIMERERRSREALEKERRQKEYLRDIISDISHQLKTPISSLTVFTDLLVEEAEQEEPGESRRLTLLRQQEQQLERMRWLTQSLLQLARLEAESVEFVKEPVEIKKLCEMVAGSFQPMAEQAGVTILVKGDTVTLLTDGDWLQEALGNVVKNAVEYSPKGGIVEIGIEHTPVATRIFVEDMGEGIPEKERLKIFERFYRVNGRSVNPSSVGIGLSLSRKIAEGCGGRLYAESRCRAECEGKEKPYTKMIFFF